MEPLDLRFSTKRCTVLWKQQQRIVKCVVRVFCLGRPNKLLLITSDNTHAPKTSDRNVKIVTG